MLSKRYHFIKHSSCCLGLARHKWTYHSLNYVFPSYPAIPSVPVGVYNSHVIRISYPDAVHIIPVLPMQRDPANTCSALPHGPAPASAFQQLVITSGHWPSPRKTWAKLFFCFRAIKRNTAPHRTGLPASTIAKKSHVSANHVLLSLRLCANPEPCVFCFYVDAVCIARTQPHPQMLMMNRNLA